MEGYLVLHGVIKTQIRQVFQVFLNNLRNVLHALGRCLRRVGERLPTPVHFRESTLKRRWRPGRLTAPAVVVALRGKFAHLGSGVRGYIGAGDGRSVAAAQGWGCEQRGLVLVLLLMVVVVIVTVHRHRRRLCTRRQGDGGDERDGGAGQLLMSMMMRVCRRGRETSGHVKRQVMVLAQELKQGIG